MHILRCTSCAVPPRVFRPGPSLLSMQSTPVLPYASPGAALHRGGCRCLRRSAVAAVVGVAWSAGRAGPAAGPPRERRAHARSGGGAGSTRAPRKTARRQFVPPENVGLTRGYNFEQQEKVKQTSTNLSKHLSYAYAKQRPYDCFFAILCYNVAKVPCRADREFSIKFFRPFKFDNLNQTIRVRTFQRWYRQIDKQALTMCITLIQSYSPA